MTSLRNHAIFQIEKYVVQPQQLRICMRCVAQLIFMAFNFCFCGGRTIHSHAISLCAAVVLISKQHLSEILMHGQHANFSLLFKYPEVIMCCFGCLIVVGFSERRGDDDDEFCKNFKDARQQRLADTS